MMFRTVTPVLVGMALAIGGCGEDAGSSAGDEPGQSRLTKEEYLAQADAICVETVEEQRKVGDRIAEARPGNIRKLLPQLMRANAKATRTGLGRLKRLRPPLADQGQVDEYLEVVEQALDASDAYVTAIRRKKRTSALRSAREGRRLDGEQEILADLLGLVDCRRLV